jgi:hypothetical protein
LQAALNGLAAATKPVIIEIHDSLVHRVDLSLLAGTTVDGTVSLRLAQSSRFAPPANIARSCSSRSRCRCGRCRPPRPRPSNHRCGWKAVRRA